jgi:hypothetical protein
LRHAHAERDENRHVHEVVGRDVEVAAGGFSNFSRATSPSQPSITTVTRKSDVPSSSNPCVPGYAPRGQQADAVPMMVMWFGRSGVQDQTPAEPLRAKRSQRASGPSLAAVDLQLGEESLLCRARRRVVRYPDAERAAEGRRVRVIVGGLYLRCVGTGAGPLEEVGEHRRGADDEALTRGGVAEQRGSTVVTPLAQPAERRGADHAVAGDQSDAAFADDTLRLPRDDRAAPGAGIGGHEVAQAGRFACGQNHDALEAAPVRAQDRALDERQADDRAEARSARSQDERRVHDGDAACVPAARGAGSRCGRAPSACDA